jgi:hypothetical protein
MKKVKLSLFADDILSYVEKTKYSTKNCENLLTVYKISLYKNQYTKNSILFPYIRNELSEK